MCIVAIDEALHSSSDEDWIPIIPKEEIEFGPPLGTGAFAQVANIVMYFLTYLSVGILWYMAVHASSSQEIISATRQ